MNFSNTKSKKPSQKLARTAARKMPSRTESEQPHEISKNPIIEKEKSELPGTPSADTVTAFFITHILPKINTPEYWKEKVLDKRSKIECEVQLDIIERVVQWEKKKGQRDIWNFRCDGIKIMY